MVFELVVFMLTKNWQGMEQDKIQPLAKFIPGLEHLVFFTSVFKRTSIIMKHNN